MALLLLAFTVVPFLELYLLIRIGRVVGSGPTLLLVIVTGLLGAALAKSQGRKVLREWRESLAAGRVPAEGVLGGILVLVGALLLITPGVLTDVFGLLCLFPPTRRVLGRALQHQLSRKVASGKVQVHDYGFQWPPRPPAPRAGAARRPPSRMGDVIDTEGEEIER